MLCEYKDGFKVDYSGSLHITKGSDLDMVVKGSQITSKCRSDLDTAVSHNSCSELRRAAQGVTDTVHETWHKS